MVAEMNIVRGQFSSSSARKRGEPH